LEHALGDANGIVEVLKVIQKNRKLVAAKPRDRVVRAQTTFELARNRDEQLVADRVAETVVDHLEAVEVEKENGEVVFGMALGLFDGEAQMICEEQAIGQARQRICERVLAQTLLSLFALSDVARNTLHADRAAGLKDQAR